MRFLIIDKDGLHVKMLIALFSNGTHTVKSATSCKEATWQWKQSQPQCVIVDPDLPDGDGIALCSQLQEFFPAFILAMSPCATADDEIAFLQKGADAYLRKPFLPAQLLAHIEALSRRASRLNTSLLSLKPTVRVGPLTVDSTLQVAILGRKSIPLSPKELRLLRFLVENRTQIVTHDLIMEQVWGLGYDATYDRNLPKSYILRIRKKLGVECVVTIPRVGYQFVVPPAWQCHIKDEKEP